MWLHCILQNTFEIFENASWKRHNKLPKQTKAWLQLSSVLIHISMKIYEPDFLK